MSLKTDRKGFTIIEVVLVLAIAGLIFLMVFIALPALQRSQKDTQRRDDLSRISTALTQYQTNNNGKLPTTGTISGTSTSTSNDAGKLLNNYLKKDSSGSGKAEFNDPNGDPYSLKIISNVNASATNTFESGNANYNVVTIDIKAKCNGESAVKTGKSSDFAILYNLEGSGTYCADNQ